MKSKKKIIFFIGGIIVLLVCFQIIFAKRHLFCEGNACIKVTYNSKGQIIKTNDCVKGTFFCSVTEEKNFDVDGHLLSKKGCRGTTIFGICNSTGGEELIRANESGHPITKIEKLKDKWYLVETDY